MSNWQFATIVFQCVSAGLSIVSVVFAFRAWRHAQANVDALLRKHEDK